MLGRGSAGTSCQTRRTCTQHVDISPEERYEPRDVSELVFGCSKVSTEIGTMPELRIQTFAAATQVEKSAYTLPVNRFFSSTAGLKSLKASMAVTKKT